MPSILGANQLDTSYEVANSARFDNTGGDALGGTFGTPTNAKKFTLSFWYKLSSGTTSGGHVFFGVRGGQENIFLHESTIRMDWGNASSGTINWAPFIRDHSAWYHFVFAQDTSQSTNSNRIKFYINGVQITTLRSGVTATYPNQNLETGYNVDGVAYYLSSYNGSAAEINGYLAEVYFADGQQYDPTYFGKFDDNGVWIPVEPGTGDGGTVTYGNNGFLLEFKQTGTGTDANGIGADTSGNDNHLAVTNLTSTNICTDTPTNNFMTWNPLDSTDPGDLTYTEGNTKVVNATGVVRGTQAAASGKWYWEIKQITTVNASNPIQYGIADTEDSPPTHSSLNNALIAYSDNDGNTEIKKFANGTESDVAMNGFTNISANDIIQFAFDADTAKLWVGINGTYLNSGDPANGTGEVASTNAGNFFTPCLEHAGVTYTIESNFGNAPYSISSGNADANGHGNFEYAVPSGFYSWNTKNLAQFG